MKYFINSDDQIFAYEDTVKNIPKGMTPITEEKVMEKVLIMNEGKPYKPED